MSRTIIPEQTSEKQQNEDKNHFTTRDGIMFNELLKINLKMNGISQSQLFLKLKIHRSIVSNWITNRHTPELQQIMNLAYIFSNNCHEFQYAFLKISQSVLNTKRSQ